MDNSREIILNKIKQALTSSVPAPFDGGKADGDVFKPLAEDLEIVFAENFTKLQGRFSFCADIEELVANLNALANARQWKNIYCVEDSLMKQLASNGYANFTSTDLKACDASITSCENLVARTGSIIMSAAEQGRTTSVYAPVHICVAFTSQLVYDIKDGLQHIKAKYGSNLPSLITLASGPSRTADIEKTLVVGVHGPKEVFCFLVDS
ncbi:LutC/YkgG family protein [Parasediminibacterium sp. JCM 36343]|uniref:LutC/YkgG family protein n=1 Tax=Parasediminibacterium sp. JCM 36343 TaxID=3374279 RepID=UPI003978EB74